MKLFHNPECSKSNATCHLLIEKAVEFEIIEYLKTPLAKEELKNLLTKLNIAAKELLRKGEAAFKENFEGKELTEEQWIDAMVQYPELIQRPIVVKGDKAVIGRPIEKVIDLLMT